MVRSVKLLLTVGITSWAVAFALQKLLTGVPYFVLALLYGLAVGALLGASLRAFSADGCDAGPPRVRQRYLREFLPAMFGYVVMLFVSLWLLKRVEPVWLRIVIALLPVLPIGFAIRAMVRFIRDTDEMQQKIELAAVSIATASVSLLYFAAGFLQSAGVIDVPADSAMICVFPSICATYGIAKTVVSRRYR